MKNIFLFLVFICLFALFCVGCALANITVDYGTVSTNAEAIRQTAQALGLPAWICSVCTIIIGAVQVLKYFFPHIDGK